jgi:DNA-binding beta-propeller fold protein YncE
MTLKPQGYVDLPAHVKPGGFDHAAIHGGRARLYVAHTINDAVDVIDCETERYVRSIPNLMGVAGALVSEERDLIFTSNRGADSVGIFSAGDERSIAIVKVGIRPNGLAFDPQRGLLLAANVGSPDLPGSFTLSIVDVERKTMNASIPVEGRTRWTVYDARAQVFYVNVAEPPQIVLVHADHPTAVARTYRLAVQGPHGLDLDLEGRRLFCACDGRQLVVLNADNGNILSQLPLSGVPDVIFYNRALQHLYVAIGDPGAIDVFDTKSMRHLETVTTESGAHTLAFDGQRNRVYAFLPQTHRAGMYVDAK